MERGAILSPNGFYRYRLWRFWNRSLPTLAWLMLNPSTADAEVDDQTVKKLIRFSTGFGYGGLEIVNLFAWRATDPAELRGWDYGSRVIGPDNDKHILEVVKSCPKTIAGWGQHGKLYGRDAAVKWRLSTEHVSLYALKLAKDGSPYHPLYLKEDLLPFSLR